MRRLTGTFTGCSMMASYGAANIRVKGWLPFRFALVFIYLFILPARDHPNFVRI